MDWLMFAIIFFCNVLTVVIFRYAYDVHNQYRDGMILGVHIPAWAVHKEVVQAICTKSSKIWQGYHWGNLVLGTSVGLLGRYSTELSIIIWLIWLLIYIIGSQILIVYIYRKMYQLKIENDWFDEETKRVRIRAGKEDGQQVTEYVDDDVYWLKGWYSNPNDKRMLVNSKFCNINMEFNMARPGAKAIVGVLTAVTLGLIIWCIYLFAPLVHIEMSLQRIGEQVQIEEGIVYINSKEKGETENWYNTITSNENIYGEKVY